jgi:Bacterial protein of unknown function (Gcw_chp)
LNGAPRQLAASGWLCACALALLAPPPACGQSEPGPIGGSLAATSDYIYRGVSQSDGHGALQADLHAGSSGGTFAGVWGSTRDSDLEPGTDGELQLYLGQRFGLSADWSATVSGRADYFVGGSAHHSDDYQEISAALTWLDRYTLSVTAIPNAVHYSTVVYQFAGYQHEYYQVYRSPAFVADAAGQWLLREGLLGDGGLYLTAAAGYYYASRSDHHAPPAVDYLYGNAGFALEWRRWRIDVGYFAAQRQAAELFPYPVAKRFAGTVSWQF